MVVFFADISTFFVANIKLPLLYFEYLSFSSLSWCTILLFSYEIKVERHTPLEFYHAFIWDEGPWLTAKRIWNSCTGFECGMTDMDWRSSWDPCVDVGGSGDTLMSLLLWQGLWYMEEMTPFLLPYLQKIN
jgi:hypothetical protein